MMKKGRTGIVLLSFLILWAIEAIHTKDIFGGLGSAVVMGTVGIVAGGLVLFNVFLFFYNVFKPGNKLSFSIYDKIIAGLWFMIIIEIFNFI